MEKLELEIFPLLNYFTTGQGQGQGQASSSVSKYTLVELGRRFVCCCVIHVHISYSLYDLLIGQSDDDALPVLVFTLSVCVFSGLMAFGFSFLRDAQHQNNSL